MWYLFYRESEKITLKSQLPVKENFLIEYETVSLHGQKLQRWFNLQEYFKENFVGTNF